MLDAIDVEFQMFVDTKKASIAGPPYMGSRAVFAEALTARCGQAEQMSGNNREILARSNFIKGKIWQGHPEKLDFTYMYKALDLGYDEIQVRLRLGVKEEERGSKAKALEHFHRVIEVAGPDHPASARAAKFILDLRKQGVAEGPAERTVEERPAESWEYAEPALGPHAFDARVSLHVKLPNTEQSLVKAGIYGIGCVRCQGAHPIAPCENCGETSYRFGLSTEGVIGLFCARCRRGFTQHRCPECSAFSPISHETLVLKRDPPKAKSGGFFSRLFGS